MSQQLFESKVCHLEKQNCFYVINIVTYPDKEFGVITTDGSVFFYNIGNSIKALLKLGSIIIDICHVEDHFGITLKLIIKNTVYQLVYLQKQARSVYLLLLYLILNKYMHQTETLHTGYTNTIPSGQVRCGH